MSPAGEERATSSLRLAFLGTPDFAVPCLEALAAAGHRIACVYSQPPRPAGRGQKPRPSPVQRAAEAAGWPHRHPTSLKDPDAQAAFAGLRLDVAVVVAYGLILPPAILEAPRLGCVNLHASLLPRWRGAAPIQRALLAGDPETGVTIMQMDPGLDSGPILLQRAREIAPDETAESLHDSLAALGAGMVVEALGGLADGTLTARDQPADGVTYAAKLIRAEGRLDWRQSAEALERQVRALTPWPGAWAPVPGPKGEEMLKVLSARVVPEAPGGTPGQVIDQALTIACGQGALCLEKVQRPGRAVLEGAAFLRGYDLPVGSRLSLPEEAPE